jgi:tight adherence protein C
MNSMAIFLVVSCVVLAGFMAIEFWKTRNSLWRRLSGLAPGAAIADKTQTKQKRLRTISKEAQRQIDAELVDFLDMLAVNLAAGESLYSALSRVLSSSNSLLKREMTALLQRVELGGQFDLELSALCQRIPTNAIREFASKLSLAIKRGTPLSETLINLSKTLRVAHSAELLRRAGANETKMLIPVVLLICPATIIFALLPSGQLLNLL